MKTNEDLELPGHAVQRKAYGTLALLVYVSEWYDFYYLPSCKLSSFRSSVCSFPPQYWYL